MVDFNALIEKKERKKQLTQQSVPLPDPENIPMESGEPMTAFKGELVSITFGDKPKQGNPPMLFNFLKLDEFPDEVKSIVPWPFPQYQLRIPYSLKGARWITFTDSIKRIPGWEATMSGKLKGHLLTLALTPGHISRHPPEGGQGDWVEVMEDMWEVVAIDDVKGAPIAVNLPNPLTIEEVAQDIAVATNLTESELLVELADGKTEAEFMQAAYSDDRVKGGSFNDLFTRITTHNAGVLSYLVANGTLKIEEGLFIKGKPDEALPS